MFDCDDYPSSCSVCTIATWIKGGGCGFCPNHYGLPYPLGFGGLKVNDVIEDSEEHKFKVVKIECSVAHIERIPDDPFGYLNEIKNRE